ncbi:MAG: YdeI family protein [Bacteroidales bacterium]
MEPIFFKNRQGFRVWLENNHLEEKEIIVGFYKVSSRKPSLTWSESVDEAICFGWIDGIRKSIDEESYCIRFTPRNPNSTWSAVNVKKAETLIVTGLMQPCGLKVYKQRKIETGKKYSYENKPNSLPENLIIKFKESPVAWLFFNAQPESYKKTIYLWILDAKQEKTQLGRLEKLINACNLKQRLF